MTCKCQACGEEYSSGKKCPECGKEHIFEPVIDEQTSNSDSPKCKHCGSSMDEAPEHINADWLCHNNGCEGSFQEEELEQGGSEVESDDEEKSVEQTSIWENGSLNTEA